ncbi:MAG: hydroxylamine oxidase [Desulfobacteraceae bacterium]|nr:hydroxylamine oxidase [Desulfobacteraceae bacterium]
MKALAFFPLLFLLLLAPSAYGEQRFSTATEECLGCHATINPGIVSAWKKSRHAAVTPAEAFKVEGLDRKISSGDIGDEMKNVVVGCAECHTLDPKSHADNFEHNGHDVHVVVSPKDCAACHAVEAGQYQKNLMAQAHPNLTSNAVYQFLIDSVNALPAVKATPPAPAHKRDLTEAESCLYCHGTKLTVTGTTSRETELGSMDFPVIAGWPNQGVGRINPDGSKGSCSACHSRHEFSMETARKPYTCKECHSGPDVPAAKVYDASKHGNIFYSDNKHWDFQKTKWTVGQDFTAPTCAACHISLLVNTEGKVIANRTHEMKERLPWRLFGLVYAHPHPREADTTVIRNKDGLPLPTNFGGEVAEKFLLTADERTAARKRMQSVCLACHAQSWVDGHWERFLNTIESTNTSTLAATQIMGDVWARGLATNHAKGGNPFDESIERQWTDVWLLWANTVRLASAMGGGGDYGVFADGRYNLRKAVQAMKEWAESRQDAKAKAKPGSRK